MRGTALYQPRQVAVDLNRAPERVSALAVRRLVLANFRNYERLVLEVDPPPVVLSGPNGAGKTNLLEALSFLSPGRGLRQARLADVSRRGAANGWALNAGLETPSGLVEIGTGLMARVDGQGDRRIVKLDGETARGPAALGRVVNVVWLTPQMDKLFVEGASGRRRFLDRLAYGFDPDHARRVSAYEQALRARARLLREGRADPTWLAALECTMAQHGVAIAALRRQVVERLRRSLDSGPGPFPRAAVAVRGRLEDWLDEMPALEVEGRYVERLAHGRAEDAQGGGEGPHRSDFEVRHVEDGIAAAQCSTGEQKALLIAIVLANARLQAQERACLPLLLLDEVAAHLDRSRRQALFDAVAALGAQAWLTGTERTLFEALAGRAQFLAVRNGALSREKRG